jgi:hypothetical protein
MRRLILFLLILFSAAAGAVHAQNYGAWLIPRIVYVGDPAVLVLPLPSTEQNTGDIILTDISPNFPKDNNIDFQRIILERRNAGSRLLVEFTAFVPGTLELPVIEIGGERFAGLTVTINSIINTNGPLELSRPAPALSMPGTALMLYGTMASLVFAVLLAVWFVFKGRKYMKIWAAKWRRRYLFVSMRNMEKRLYRSLNRGADKRDILDTLSEEFRKFLSFLSDKNCRAMTAREFEKLPKESGFNGVFLGNFFRSCDNLRFSGSDIKREEIVRLLGDMRGYLVILKEEAA